MLINIEIMEKKNINIWVVRTCTILLLIVFTIGRKYGEEQKKAIDLIVNLKQQPCACCLNFNNVEKLAQGIDAEKNQLQDDKNQLGKDNEKLVGEKENLEKAKNQLQTYNDILEVAKTSLEKEKETLLGEKNDLLVEKNLLRNNNIRLEEEIQKKNVQNNQLLVEKKLLIADKNQLEENKNQLIKDNNKLLIDKNQIEKEKNDFDDLLKKQNKEKKKLIENIEAINNEKTTLNNLLSKCQNLAKRIVGERDSFAELLKTAKINVNTEEYVKYFNNIFVDKKAKIETLSQIDEENLMPKEYTFYIPFKFKDYGKCFKGEDMLGLFNHEVGYYSDDKSLDDILKSLFLRYGIEQINKDKIINVKILKEIYFYVNFYYGDDGKIISNIKSGKITVPNNCFLPTEKNKGKKNNNSYEYKTIADGECYKNYKDKILLNYYNLIDLVKIDEYLGKKGKNEDLKNLFLLELDLKDPECIALLEFVGKGNYGVVRKGLTFENGKLVTKAIKFTCHNIKFENSDAGNIVKEIRAGKIINEIGVGNKIAFVQDYMKISNFIGRYNYDKEKNNIVPLEEEINYGLLDNAVYTTFLNKKLETLPNGKQNVYEEFKNNVFSFDGTIVLDLYIMFMDMVDGKDLFLNEKKDLIDINSLGKMLFDVLDNLCISGVALKDIKPKNIMLDDKKNEFSIIDVQTLGKVGRNLTDSYGTPELWPFFKTLNLNLESENEIKNNEIKDNDKKDNDKKDNLYDRFCYSIDDNFVDIYAACMTMYFAKFNTYTAAGLLTLLLKWIILEKETNKDFEKNNLNIKGKIDFLKNYAGKYTSYITDIKNKEKIEDLTKEQKPIKDFFEEIDDKNLNDNQKKDLAYLLKQVIILGNDSNIFYLLKEINEKFVKEKDEKCYLKDDIKNIIDFYKECVKEDFKNFATLDEGKCNYADVIKYVLCYGSCLNYNGEKEEKTDVNIVLQNLKLKGNIGDKDNEFFAENENGINNVIDKLKKGFNQTFIIDLLNILSLEEYEKILNYGVSKNGVDFYFENKKKSKEYNIEDNNIIDTKKKVFYLLRYLEINRLFHIPKNLLKIHSLINENTDNKNEENFL